LQISVPCFRKLQQAIYPSHSRWGCADVPLHSHLEVVKPQITSPMAGLQKQHIKAPTPKHHKELVKSAQKQLLLAIGELDMDTPNLLQGLLQSRMHLGPRVSWHHIKNIHVDKYTAKGILF